MGEMQTERWTRSSLPTDFDARGCNAAVGRSHLGQQCMRPSWTRIDVVELNSLGREVLAITTTSALTVLRVLCNLRASARHRSRPVLAAAVRATDRLLRDLIAMAAIQSMMPRAAKHCVRGHDRC